MLTLLLKERMQNLLFMAFYHTSMFRFSNLSGSTKHKQKFANCEIFWPIYIFIAKPNRIFYFMSAYIDLDPAINIQLSMPCCHEILS